MQLYLPVPDYSILLILKTSDPCIEKESHLSVIDILGEQ